MAFAVTKFNAYGLKNTNQTIKRGIQKVELTITGANTDTAYDLGTTGGTFWTSAVAHATYGEIATAARTFILTTLTAQVGTTLGIKSQELLARLQAASASSTDYIQTVAAVTTPVPELAFHSGDAPTSAVWVIEWLLADNMEPLFASYG